MKTLITGGAGFIGVSLSRVLLANGVDVVIIDNFNPQIHGASVELPSDISGHVRLIRASINDRDALADAMHKVNCIVHLAAETGTGQSMYEVERYGSVNLGGTSVLLDLLVNDRARYDRLQKLVVASSRAIYGEGKYQCQEHGTVYPGQRSKSTLERGQFDPECPVCSRPCKSLPTDEATPKSPTSFYGLTKQVQEDMILLFARTLNISGYALRYQNVYGPGQSLQNPYTGILAVFSNLARENLPINVFEDGQESRDFVYIDDVVDATWRCVAAKDQRVASYNVGSGIGTSVMDVAKLVVKHFDSQSTVSVNGAFRLGDIRHNVADLSRVRDDLGFVPTWDFRAGLKQFLNWAGERDGGSTAGYVRSLNELRSKGLMHG